MGIMFSIRWVILLSGFLSFKALAFNEPTFIVDSDRFTMRQLNDYSLGNFSQKLTEAEISQYINDGGFELRTTYNLQYNKYFYFGYRIDNRLSQSKFVFLKLPGTIEDSQIFTAQNGKLIPWARYPGNHDAFYAEMPPGTTIAIGHRKSGGNITGHATSVKLSDFRTMVSLVQIEQEVISLVTGAVAIMVFYNLGMFVFFRKTYFLYYSFYSVCALFSIFTFSGQSPFSVPALAMWTSLASLSLLLFCKTALSLSKDQAILNKMFTLFYFIIVVVGLQCYGTKEVSWLLWLVPMTFCLCIAACAVRLYQGFRPALYLLIGWGVFCLGFLVSFSNFLTVGREYLSWGAVIGFALELCFFSFANSQKARFSEEQALRENEHAFNQLEKVFYPHQIKLMKSGVQLEKTMPTGSGWACVISFDIIGSSRIDHPRAKNFLEDSLKACLSIVSLDYNPDALEARAYRIKEMGDGFLCSVGFPFQTPNDEKLEDAAVRLALDFVKEFETSVINFFGEPSVFCSIALAVDHLEGYFPRTGTIEYDVYGRAIILATRYESVRKALFPQGFEGHLVTLQEKVYHSLSPELQKEFILLDLASRQMSVRDDLMATELAYRVISPKESLKIAG